MTLGIIFFLQLLFIGTETRFYFYTTHYLTENDSFSHCLYYKVLDNIVLYYRDHEKFQSPSQIIPYCFRPLTMKEIENLAIIINNNILSSMAFEEMRKEKINAKDLLSWSAPIDLIENYQSYLESESISLMSEWYYNCSGEWFGQFCQYTFDSNELFTDIVTETFRRKEFDMNVEETNLTCYVLIDCDRGPPSSCLDWREICDGTVDCLNGIDEINCLELEITRCNENEYRCYQGMCILEQFLNDSPYNPDCLDSSDEDDYTLKDFR